MAKTLTAGGSPPGPLHAVLDNDAGAAVILHDRPNGNVGCMQGVPKWMTVSAATFITTCHSLPPSPDMSVEIPFSLSRRYLVAKVLWWGRRR